RAEMRLTSGVASLNYTAAFVFLGLKIRPPLFSIRRKRVAQNWPQRPHDRAAGIGQDHAGQTAGRGAAAAQFSGGDRDHESSQHRWYAAFGREPPARAPLSRTPSQH